MNLKNLLLTAAIISFCLLNNNLVAQPTSGLVGHFKLDGSVTNTGPASMTATPHNVTYTTNGAGASNKAIKFAGTLTSDVVITDNANLDFTGDFSIAFGVNPTTLAVNQGFYDNGLNYGGCGIWYFLSDNTLRFNFKNGSIGAPAALTAGQWKAVCIIRSGTAMLIYVNGVLSASGTQGTSALTYPNAPVLGQMYFAAGGGNYNPSSAALDEMRFYNRALSAAEVSQLVGFSLPLKMGNFTATKQTTGIQLNWETLSEQNTSSFGIERSTDGSSFISLGTVNARGSSATKQSYNFTDAQPGAGNNFYRLKLIDADGAFTYSRVIIVKNDNSLVKVQLFPNPVSEVLQVQIPSQRKETANISIADATGRIVYRTTMQVMEGNNAISIPVQQYVPGKYYLITEINNAKTTNSFIKR
jgi:Concanavalin A-like lectin/glucanases superfamily/Secretion system C-terminal sorting domain